MTERVLRADAARNRERVVRAATELFARHGIATGIPDVAALAGVGKATVYRSFPTKQHLVAAVVVERLRWFERLWREAAERPDAWAAFAETLGVIMEAEASDHTIAAGLYSGELALEDVDDARGAALGALAAVIDRARAAGAMRADATTDDVRILFAGCARMLADDGTTDRAAWTRCAELIVAALAAPAA